MRIVTTFPHRVEEHEHILIPMSDGAHLAARLWLPVDAVERPVPAILEYIPYRKRDITRERDAMNHAYLAGHGYACIRVDLRGSGDSDGVITDQYLHQEQDDAVEVIRWLAQQPWCDGKVGMMGISWGGFNSLQVAARRPPELKAIITACSTDDLYADNMHYMGGCLLSDNLSEATTMLAFNSLPPDPALVGDRWREMWMERLGGSGHWLDTWLRHQWRDDYWRRGSVCENYGDIQCPVMASGGWADGYSNAVFRLLAHLNVPRIGLIGPWSHKWPHQGIPGPAIGYLQEALRWWDYWLKGRETGIMDEPMLRFWMQDSVPPTTYLRQRPGRWVAEASWPSPRIDDRYYPLDIGRIAGPHEAVEERIQTIQSPLSVGLFAGKWCSYAATPDLPHDQREEDGGALVFDGPVLGEDLEIMGAPEVELDLSADRPVAMVAVRLSDVAPDDSATRVTYGLLNLTHRHGDSRPSLLEPGARYRVCVPLNGVAQRFPRGHRIRVSISTSYWPLAWAPPEPVRLAIYMGASRLKLPVRPHGPGALEPEGFGPAEGAATPEIRLIEPTEHNWWVVRNLAKDVSTLQVVKNEGRYRIEEIDLEVRDKTLEWYTYQNDDRESLRGETQTVRALQRGAWSIQVDTRTVLTADRHNFYLTAELDAYEGEKRVYSQNWDRVIPREFA